MGGGNCETGYAAPHDARGVHCLAGGKERVLGLYIRQTAVQQAQLQSVCKKGRGWVNAAHLQLGMLRFDWQWRKKKKGSAHMLKQNLPDAWTEYGAGMRRLAYNVIR